jgi:hypothetical protein
MMTNKLLLLFPLLLIWSIALGQNSSSIRRKNIKKIEQKQLDYNDGNEIIVRWSLDEYDSKGRIISQKQLNTDSTFKVFETFKYDKKGRIILHSEFDKFGKLKKKTFFTFDNMNDRTEERVFNSNIEMIELTRFTYNSFGLKTLETTLKPDGLTVIRKIAFKYDSKGSLIERKVFNEKEDLIQTRNYSIKYD